MHLWAHWRRSAQAQPQTPGCGGQLIRDRKTFPLHPARMLRQALLRRSHSPITRTCKSRLYTPYISSFAIEVPPSFTFHSEKTTHVLLPSNHDVFLNPVQEFTRGLSVSCIQVWSEEWGQAKEGRWSGNRIGCAAAGDCVPGCCGRFEEPRGIGRSQGRRGIP